MTEPRWSLDSWRRASDPVVYITAVLFLASILASIWLDDIRWAGSGGAVVFTLACVVALTEERRPTP
jgi:hypothetical protein